MVLRSLATVPRLATPAHIPLGFLRRAWFRAQIRASELPKTRQISFPRYDEARTVARMKGARPLTPDLAKALKGRAADLHEIRERTVALPSVIVKLCRHH